MYTEVDFLAHATTTCLAFSHGRRSHRSWGDMTPPLLEAKGTGGHNLGIIHLTYCSYHAFTLMSTPCRLYSGNILSPHWPKSGGGGPKKFFCSLRSQNLSPPLPKPWRRPWSHNKIKQQLDRIFKPHHYWGTREVQLVVYMDLCRRVR